MDAGLEDGSQVSGAGQLWDSAALSAFNLAGQTLGRAYNEVAVDWVHFLFCALATGEMNTAEHNIACVWVF